jgi:hypothetical protein
MGLITYNFSITGDCSNTSSGTLSLSYTASAPPLSINWINPISGVSFSSQTLTENPYVVTGLSGGVYTFTLTDFDPTPTTIDGGFFISTSNTVSVSAVTNTYCGKFNGAILVENPNTYVNNTLSLYDLSGNPVVIRVDPNSTSPITSTTTNSPVSSFINLSPGFYYVKSVDYGGCVATSQTVLVKPSSELNFGFYVVNSPFCVLGRGQIHLTGVTGISPYTYKWSSNIDTSYNITTGNTNISLTGLNSGDYSLTITDAGGCSRTESVRVGITPQLGLINYTFDSPSCFGVDGSITFNFSGGTAPFYYQLSNGDSQVILSNQVTFSGLSSGNYTLNVTDSGLCTTSAKVTLLTPSSFSVINTIKKDANCLAPGSLNINLIGGSPPYNYALSGINGNLSSQNVISSSASFTSLSPGSYLLTITDSKGVCTYNENITIQNYYNFDISAYAIGTQCGGDNGSISVSVNNPIRNDLKYTYSLSNGLKTPESPAESYTFDSLKPGPHTVFVTDQFGCTRSQDLFVTSSDLLSVFLYPTSCVDGNSGTITALIKDADGPFTFTWSENVGNQTGIFVTGLTAGTYSLTISNYSGCTQKTFTTISCNPLSASNYTVKFKEGTVSTTQSTKFTLKNMMYSGYTSLVSNAIGCSLSSATFSFRVNISGIDYQFPFYYTQSFNDIPDLGYFAGIIQSSVLTIPNIVSCVVDADTNAISIVSSGSGGYRDETISFTIIIDFVINCTSINDVICVSPTPTPSITPTITITPSISATTTPTPSVTPTITPSGYRYLFSVSSGATQYDACFGTGTTTIYGVASLFDYNSEFYNSQYGPVTVVMSGYYSLGGVVCELDTGGNVVGVFGVCPSPTPTVTPSITPTITPTLSITPTNTNTVTQTPSETPTNTPTVTPTKSVTPTITTSVTPTIGFYSYTLGTGTTETTACSDYWSSPETLYAPSSGGTAPNVGEFIYLDAGPNPTNPATDGFYSDGFAWYQVSGGTGLIIAADPNGCTGLITPTVTPTNTPTPSVTSTNTPTPTNTQTPTVTPSV